MGLKKWTRGLRGQPGQALTVQVLCLGLLFTLGMVGGYLYAASCGERSQLALAEYLSGFCDLYQEGAVRTVPLFTAARLYFTEFLAGTVHGALFPVGGCRRLGARVLPSDRAEGEALCPGGL